MQTRQSKMIKEDSQLVLLETMPSELEFKDPFRLPSIGEGILALIKSATVSIDISSFYMTLLNTETEPLPSDNLGKSIYNELLAAACRGVTIRIVVTPPSETIPETDAINLAKLNPSSITTRFLDMSKVVSVGSGINHTKFYLVDKRSFYLGSANADWRAYSEVAEIGIIGTNTVEATLDLGKIFDMYWDAALNPETAPKNWPAAYSTVYNITNPMVVSSSRVPLFFSAAPDPFLTCGRTPDLNAVLEVINKQRRGGALRLCAMAFSNMTSYEKSNFFWGKIDYALRKATMKRGVEVFLMVEDKELRSYKVRKSLLSLQGYNKIYVKTTKFPPLSVDIPFARLFHSKLVIGDQGAWIGTSNLQPDYFLDTTGIGCNVYGSSKGGLDVIEALKSYFDRYYHSQYASFLDVKLE